MSAVPLPSARVREGVRQCMAWMHGWTGLLLGWLLLVICASGTLAVFRPEIGRWTRPEAIVAAPPATATAAAVRWLGRHAATSPAWYLRPPDARDNSVQATWYDGKRYVTRALDAVTGEPAARQSLGGEFFYRLHFELQLPYPWGRMLASLAATFMLVAIVTGTIAHKRIFRDLFTFRPGRHQRAWLDAHNAFGVLSLPFHVMITFTGLLTLVTTTLPWGIVANYGSDTARMYAELLPGGVNRAAASRPAPLAPVAPMLAEAQRRFGGEAPGAIAIVNPGDAAATVIVARSDAHEVSRAGQQLTLDGTTGGVIGGWTEHGRPAVATYNMLYGLHMAHFADLLLRWLYAIGGAMLTGTVATGLILWVVKRRERAPLSIGNRIAERINVGIIAGTPIAFMAFFIANRLLPLGLDGRATQEVAAVFWTWGAALALALALPPRRSWPMLLGAAACACAAAPILSLADPAAALPVTLARGDFALAGGDLVMLAAALGFARAAMRSRRVSPPASARARRVAALAAPA